MASVVAMPALALLLAGSLAGAASAQAVPVPKPAPKARIVAPPLRMRSREAR